MTRIKDVAEYAGVSVSSVSRYLNAPESLKNETREKVHMAVEALQYSPSSLARGLRSRTTNRIAFIIPSLANMYFLDLYGALHNEASKKGYTINLLTTDYNSQTLREYMSQLPTWGVDGVVIAFLDNDDVIPDIRRAQQYASIVLLSSLPNRQEFNTVFLDVEEGMIKSTQHLIDKGCTKIAFIGGLKEDGATQEKQSGFEIAMRNNNLEIEPELFYFGPNHFTTGFWGARQFLRLPVRPDGVVCCTDDIAMGCIKQLIRSGLKVPMDVKVIGFNGISFINTYEPAISSLQHPMASMAVEVVNLLYNSIVHPGARKQQITFHTTLVVNTSTDPMAPDRL